MLAVHPCGLRAQPPSWCRRIQGVLSWPCEKGSCRHAQRHVSMVILHHRVPVLSPGPQCSRAVDPGVCVCVWAEGLSIFSGAKADRIEAAAAVLGGWAGRKRPRATGQGEALKPCTPSHSDAKGIEHTDQALSLSNTATRSRWRRTHVLPGACGLLSERHDQLKRLRNSPS